MVAGGRVRRREIEEDDVGSVADLLVRGFPRRPRRYWSDGLRRLAGREPPSGCPRFGYMLEAAGRPVGVVLLIFHLAETADAAPALRCNLSSWYVEPAYRMHAPLLVASALKRRDVTYTNISPAPHTWDTIEAQGFSSYATGQILAVPAIGRVRDVRVHDGRDAAIPVPEAKLLADHAAYGCLSLVVEDASGSHPFVFLPVRIRSGRWRLPVAQPIFCRHPSDLGRLGGVLGRCLLRHGIVGLLLDAGTPLHGLLALREIGGRKYFRGPHPPRLGDLSYTERAILGA